MPNYQITGADGKKYRVTGDTPEGAVAALKKHVGSNAGSHLTDGDKESPIPDGMIEAGKRAVASSTAEQDKTYSGAGTTWLEHAISDLPIVGPAIQTGADYVGTEVIGRLSGQDPAQMREDMWKRREQRDQDYPASAVSGGIAGNVAAFGAGGATASGARALGITGETLLGRAANSALTTGAISSADTAARGGGPIDILGSGGIAAATGAAIPVIGKGIEAGVRAVGEKAAPFIGGMSGAEREAERRVGVAMTRDKIANPSQVMNAADEAAAADAGIPVTNVDRGGETTRALARSAANQSPEARAAIEKTANDRFSAQSKRASDFVKNITGGSADDIAVQDRLRAEASKANKPAYDKAFADPAAQDMFTPGLKSMLASPAIRQAAKEAETRGANRAVTEGFKPIRNPFTFDEAGNATLRTNARPTLQFWDQVKKNLDGDIGKAIRAGDNTLAADITALKNKLVAELDSAVPSYKDARAGAAAFFGAEDALDAGRKFANTPKMVPEARKAFQKLSQPEQAAFATGYASELTDRIRASGDRTNVITTVFKSQAARDSMEMVFGPAKMRKIEAYVRVEDIVDRLRGSMGNSTTARQLVELGIGATGGYSVSGDWKGAIGGAALAKGVRYAGARVDEKVMRRVATLLTSNDPGALKAAVTTAAMNPKYMQALELYGTLLAAPARAGAVKANQ